VYKQNVVVRPSRRKFVCRMLATRSDFRSVLVSSLGSNCSQYRAAQNKVNSTATYSNSALRHLFGLTMVQAISSLRVITESRVRSRASLCGICGGRSGSAIRFCPSVPVSASEYNCTIVRHSCFIYCIIVGVDRVVK
jgi:hypothetical protein